MISHYLHYQFALLALLLKGDIDAATWRYAAWNRPIVVCGRTGSWGVGTPPGAMETTIRPRALVEFFVGMLIVAGAVGWIAHAVERVGFAGALNVATFKAVIVIALGLVLALDATAVGLYRWGRLPYPSSNQGKEEASC